MRGQGRCELITAVAEMRHRRLVEETLAKDGGTSVDWADLIRPRAETFEQALVETRTAAQMRGSVAS